MEGWYKGERFALKKKTSSHNYKSENLKLSGHPDRRFQEEMSSSSKSAGRFPSYSRDINVFNWNQQ